MEIQEDQKRMDSIWVLRECDGSLVHMQFIDMNMKLVYADDYVVDFILNDNQARIGNRLFQVRFSGDTLFLKDSVSHYIFRKYTDKKKSLEKSKITQTPLVLKQNGAIFYFKDKYISIRNKNKRQLEVIDGEGSKNGNWSLYEINDIILVRFKLEYTKDEFLLIRNIDDSGFDALKWIDEIDQEVLLNFNKVHMPR